jgi:hypothetical protein
MNIEEYINKLSQLLVKYRPELYNNIFLIKLKNKIKRKLRYILNQISKEKLNNCETLYSSGNNININNRAYEYYKLGMEYYNNVLPDNIYELNISRKYEYKTFEKEFEELNVRFISLNIAEYYFNKVINDYPNTEWTWAAKEKLKCFNKEYENMENINNKEYVYEYKI